MLVTYDEIAELAGVTIGRLRNLKTQGMMPAPLGVLGQTPVWDMAAIEHWQKRRPQGSGQQKRRRRESVEPKALEVGPAVASVEPKVLEVEPVGVEPEATATAEPEAVASVEIDGKRFVGECSCGFRTPSMVERKGAERRLAGHECSIQRGSK